MMAESLAGDFELSQVKLRPARRSDYLEIVDLVTISHARAYAPEGFDVAQHRNVARAAAKKHSFMWRTYLVAERNDCIVGAAQIFGDTIPSLYVDPEFQSRGIGSRLLQLAESRIRERGWNVARLRVAEVGRRAINFYERNGWTIGKSLPADERWGLALLEMTKVLTVHEDAGFAQNLADASLKFALAALLIVGAIGLVWLLQFVGDMPQSTANITAVLVVLWLFIALAASRISEPRTVRSRSKYALWIALYELTVLSAVAIVWMVAFAITPRPADQNDRVYFWIVALLGILPVSDWLARRYILVRLGRLFF